jgi:glycosyltransferase involved in cell wall biosynthesis
MRVSLSAAQPNVPHVPSAFSPDGFTPAKRIRLGWVGRFDSDKHPEHMSELIEILERDFGIEAEGVMMGGHIDGDRRKNFRVHPRIEVLGWIDYPSSVLKKCDLNIMTSAREGYALGPLEAALVGTPTVAYRNSGTSESIPDVGGLLVTSRDIFGLASAIFQYANFSLERKLEWRRKVRRLGMDLAKTSDPAAEMCHFIESCATDRTP